MLRPGCFNYLMDNQIGVVAHPNTATYRVAISPPSVGKVKCVSVLFVESASGISSQFLWLPELIRLFDSPMHLCVITQYVIFIIRRRFFSQRPLLYPVTIREQGWSPRLVSTCTSVLVQVIEREHILALSLGRPSFFSVRCRNVRQRKRSGRAWGGG